MSSRKVGKSYNQERAHRVTTNVFDVFDPRIQEAFNTIDQNHGGFVDKKDLHDILASLGKNPTDGYLDAMINKASGPLNLTIFLTLIIIKNAFGCIDERNTGSINENKLRELLITMDDRFTDEDVKT